MEQYPPNKGMVSPMSFVINGKEILKKADYEKEDETDKGQD